MDTTPELNSVEVLYYMSLIGVLRWMVELGRVDMCVEVLLTLSHMALPCVGHLDQLYHIFSYLRKHHNSEIIFDLSEPDLDLSLFEQQDWSTTVYGDKLKEELPPGMPEPRGQGRRRRRRLKDLI